MELLLALTLPLEPEPAMELLLALKLGTARLSQGVAMDAILYENRSHYYYRAYISACRHPACQ